MADAKATEVRVERGGDADQVRESLEAVAEGREGPRAVGDGVHEKEPGDSPRKKGKKVGGGEKKERPEPPVEPWTIEDVRAVFDLPFDLAYVVFAQDWWLAGRAKVQAVYPKFQYVFTRLKVRPPLLIIMSGAVVTYVGTLITCAVTSWAARAAKEAVKAKGRIIEGEVVKEGDKGADQAQAAA